MLVFRRIHQDWEFGCTRPEQCSAIPGGCFCIRNTSPGFWSGSRQQAYKQVIQTAQILPQVLAACLRGGEGR